MARTRATPMRRRTPPPKGPRVPKKEGVAVREDIETKEVERIVVTGPRMEIYWGDEGVTLQWKESTEEELYPYWGDAMILHQLTDEEATLLCSKMTDMNIYQELHILYSSESSTKMLLDHFRPTRAVIWISEPFSNDFLYCEEFDHSSKVSFLSHEKETLYNYKCLSIRRDMEQFAIESETRIEWQYGVLKDTFDNWINGENALTSFHLAFPEASSATIFEASVLTGLSYEVLWRYNDHANSIIKDQDIERFKEYEGKEAVVFALSRPSTQQRALVIVVEKTLDFQVLTPEMDEANEVDGRLYCAAVRFT